MINKENMLISIVMTSYNWPEVLKQNLLSLKEQSDTNFEVIITDDGSGPEVKEMINKLKPILPFKLKYLWQKDNGFHNSKTRNRGIAETSGDYIIFLDQDCIPHFEFIKRMRQLSEERYFCTFKRVFIHKKLSKKYLETNFKLHKKQFLWFLAKKILNQASHTENSLCLPFGFNRYKRKQTIGGHSFIGVWKADLIKINGFNEKFKGWGYEDTDLICRLIQHDIHRKLAHFYCFVSHIYHAPNFASKDRNKNEALFKKTLAGKNTNFPGLDQYL
eukprot:COSAG01_NODE_69_length_28801_cov_10.460038_19_plen_274_part_00